MKVHSRESQDENLECSADGYTIKIARSGRQRRHAYLREIVPVVVDWTQKFACGTIVKPSPTLVADREGGVWLRGAFHEPMDHQDFESVGILIAPTVRSFSELNLLEQSVMRLNERPTHWRTPLRSVWGT